MLIDGKVLGELITLKSANGLDLDGIVYREEQNRITVIHIPGSFGNFYQNRFIRMMAKAYLPAGINLVSINMSSHDGLAEGNRWDKDFEYVGGAVTDFNECVRDIQGVVSYVSGFGDRVILQGHSLGCDRVLQFLISTKRQYDAVLLSPCDSYQLQANWIAPETVEQQIQRLKAEAPSDPVFDWLPSREYGVKGGGDWTYPIPVTRETLLSIMEGAPYHLIRIKSPAQFYLEHRALIYIGGMDRLQAWSGCDMFRYLRKRIRSVTEVYVPQGDHSLAGCEALVIQRIIEWACA